MSSKKKLKRAEYLASRLEMRTIVRSLGFSTEDHEENVYKLELLSGLPPMRGNLRERVIRAVAAFQQRHPNDATDVDFAPKEAIRVFYKSDEWKTLRHRVLLAYKRRCMYCGEVEAIIAVDHIKPLRKYWHLRLDFNNMQVLCSYCNREKGSWDETDYRGVRSFEPYPFYR